MFDPIEYERIVDEYGLAVYRYCLYKLQDEDLAQDTMADVLDILFRKWDKLDRGENIRAYLYRVADQCIKHNLSKYYQYYSRHKPITTLDPNLLHGACFDEYFKEEDIPEEEYMIRIRDSLPEKYRQLFTYRYIEKRTLVGIVELTGVPYSTLRGRFDMIEKLVRKEIKKILK